MKTLIALFLTVATVVPSFSAAEAPDAREGHRRAVRVVRDLMPSMTTSRWVATALVVSGIATGVLQGVAPTAVWGEAAFPMALFGMWMSASAVGVGALVGLFAETPYAQVSRHSLLTSEPEFTRFMALPEDEQLDRMARRPDLAEFIERLADYLIQSTYPRAPSRPSEYRLRNSTQKP